MRSNYKEIKAEADKLCAIGYIAYPSIAVFGQTDDEHIYSLHCEGFLHTVKFVVPSIHKASNDDATTIDDIVF